MRKAFKKNKSFVEEVEMLQETVTGEKAFQEVAKTEFAQLNSSVEASNALIARLTGSEKSSGTFSAEVALLRKQVALADAGKTDSYKVVADVWKQSEQLLVRLNFALVNHHREEKLTRSLT